jgi:hypothetical protein
LPLHHFARLARFPFCDNQMAADVHSIVLHDLADRTRCIDNDRTRWVGHEGGERLKIVGT